MENGEVTMPPSGLGGLINLTPGTAYVFGNFFTGFVMPVNFGLFKREVERMRIGVVGLPTTSRQGHAPHPIKSIPSHPNPDGVVVGIIDHGIGFVSQHFADRDAAGQWQSRIERVWDQQRGYPAPPLEPAPGVPANTFWTATQHYGYGRELANTGGDQRIDYWLNQGHSEAETYRRLQYAPAQGAVAHGTHVLGSAAGNRSYAPSTHDRPWHAVSDKASQASIIAVQLPALPYKDTSGTGLCVQILDAISYIHLHAAGRKVVINLSDGAYAGPHDGTSMLERAIDDFYGRNADRSALVVAAGNQFNERVHWHGESPANGGTAEPITWNILPDDSTDSHLEIWPDSQLTGQALQQLKVRVTPPGLAPLDMVPFGQTNALFADGDPLDESAIAMVAFICNPPNSFSSIPATALAPRGMVHVAVAATRTRQGNGRAAAPHGIWQVELINDGPQPVTFNAYIERDNPALGDRGPTRQSHFVHANYPRNTGRLAPLDDSCNTSPIKRMGALNSVATSLEGLVVGGVSVNADATGLAHPILAPYTASGPGRRTLARDGVDLLAPSDSSQTIRGIRGCATRSGTSFRMDGTSVAAPQVTRAMVNLIATGLDASAAKQSLRTAANRKPIKVLGPAERVGAGLI